jgi:hypothetical protein
MFQIYLKIVKNIGNFMGLRFCRNLDFEKVKKGGLDFKEIVR